MGTLTEEKEKGEGWMCGGAPKRRRRAQEPTLDILLVVVIHTDRDMNFISIDTDPWLSSPQRRLVLRLDVLRLDVRVLGLQDL